MLGRDRVLDEIVKRIIVYPDLSWGVIFEDSIARHKITKREVEEEVRKRRDGGQPPLNGAGVPRRPLPSEGTGSISLPLPKDSEDDIK